jgi:hypothetical protein
MEQSFSWHSYLVELRTFRVKNQDRSLLYSHDRTKPIPAKLLEKVSRVSLTALEDSLRARLFAQKKRREESSSRRLVFGIDPRSLS